MTPATRSKLRDYRWAFMLLGVLIVLPPALYVLHLPEIHKLWNPRLVPTGETVVVPSPSPIMEAPLTYLYVLGNNTFLYPVVGGKCSVRKSLAQYHRDDMVEVLKDHGTYIEVRTVDAERAHRHGCIHRTMLGGSVSNGS